MKKFIAIVGLSALSLAGVVGLSGYSAQAAEFVAPKGEDGLVTLNRSESYQNLYIAGGDVSVSSNVSGDLYAGGGSVSVDGPVSGDIVVAGGTVTISEPVGGDVRVAGGKVTINAAVTGDVLAGAGVLVLTDKSSIGGELRVAGGTVVVNGPVAGGTYLMADSATLNSKIDGTVKVTANRELILGSGANIATEISYLGNKEAVVNEGANAKVSFTEMKQHQRDRGERAGLLGFLLGGFIIKFFATVLAGLLALRLFRGQIAAVTDSMLTRTWANLGIGFAAIIVVPIAAILALVLVVGYYIALIAFVAYLLALLVAGLMAALFLGAWIVKLLTKKPALVLDWQALVIGTVALMLLRFIPIVGWIICLGLFLIAFGAMVSYLWNYIKRSSGHSRTGITEIQDNREQIS